MEGCYKNGINLAFLGQLIKKVIDGMGEGPPMTLILYSQKLKSLPDNSGQASFFCAFLLTNEHSKSFKIN